MDPQDRFATAAEFAEALAGVSVARGAAREGRWRVAAALAALALTLAAAIALLAGR
jgi:hypothetical protein